MPNKPNPQGQPGNPNQSPNPQRDATRREPGPGQRTDPNRSGGDRSRPPEKNPNQRDDEDEDIDRE
jgi:hypothetical protein